MAGRRRAGNGGTTSARLPRSGRRMNDYVGVLARRQLEAPAIVPRRAGRYEPHTGWLAPGEVDELVEPAAPDGRHPSRSMTQPTPQAITRRRLVRAVPPAVAEATRMSH